ncbi:MAG: RNA 2'-phosphotransferase [Bacteroidota bacterium]
MTPKTLKRTSKKISLVLRHKPEAIGLTLDTNGWTTVEHLLERMAATGTPLTREELQTIVVNNDKQRFRFNPDGTKIRANQGHSIDIDLQLTPVPPPAVLYHGTATRAVPSIKKTGLRSQQRQHVHLSLELETAVAVGGRHGKPIVFQVDAAGMARDGYTFFCSDNGVWLTASVPPKYLSLS